MLKRIVIFLLALVCLLVPLTACQNGEGEKETGASTEEGTDGNGDGFYLDTLPKDKQYDFKNIKIATIDTNIVLKEQPEDADAVDAEKYNRDYYLRDYYGMQIEYVQIDHRTSDAEEAADIVKMVQTNLDKIDIFIHQPDNLMSLALYDLATDLNTIDTLSLEQEWWSQSLNKNISFNGAQYIAAGPVSEWYYGAVLALAYNKTMAKTNNMGDFYSIVSSGDWTLEKMNTICTDFNITDPNNDPSKANEGTYMISFASGVGSYGLFASAGGSFATIDDDKGIVISLADKKSVDILEKVIGTFDKSKTYYGNVENTSKAFTESRAMFLYNTIGWMEGYLPMSKVDYGIIPCPKYDKSQENYISCGWPSSSYAVAIPKTVTGERLEWAGMFLEAYCYLGYDMIKPVKYDSVVKYRVARDEQSSELLDLIFKDVYYDINLVVNFGGSRTMVGNTIVQGLGGYTGKMAGIKPLIDKDIAKYAELVAKS